VVELLSSIVDEQATRPSKGELEGAVNRDQALGICIYGLHRWQFPIIGGFAQSTRLCKILAVSYTAANLILLSPNSIFHSLQKRAENEDSVGCYFVLFTDCSRPRAKKRQTVRRPACSTLRSDVGPLEQL
jgi:hypothetical protein